MASKTYIVMKDGEEIEKLKTLTAAKELANAEGAEVYCGEKCVYRGIVKDDVSSAAVSSADDSAVAAIDDADSEGAQASADGTDPVETSASTDGTDPAETSGLADCTNSVEIDTDEKGLVREQEAEAEKSIVTAEPVVAKKPKQIETKPVETVRYRLKKLMNIRQKPSLDARIVSIKAEGTIVRTIGMEGDWLRLSDGNFVLYGGGEFAEKVEE